MDGDAQGEEGGRREVRDQRFCMHIVSIVLTSNFLGHSYLSSGSKFNGSAFSNTSGPRTDIAVLRASSAASLYSKPFAILISAICWIRDISKSSAAVGVFGPFGLMRRLEISAEMICKSSGVDRAYAMD